MDNDERGSDANDDYIRGGKGRRDEVGRSGIYPASSPDAPAGAPTRGQEELGHTSGAREDLVEVPKPPDAGEDREGSKQ